MNGGHHRAGECFGNLGTRTQAHQRLGPFNDFFRFDPNVNWRMYFTLGAGQEEKPGPEDQEQEDINSA